MVGPRCSDGARLFPAGPYWRVLTSTFACRWVWIMNRRVVGAVHCAHCSGSLRDRTSAGLPTLTWGGSSREQGQGPPGMTAVTAHYLICALRTPLRASLRGKSRRLMLLIRRYAAPIGGGTDLGGRLSVIGRPARSASAR